MDDTEHLNPGVTYFVEDQVLPDGNASITESKVVPPESGARRALEHIHALKEGVDEPVSGAFVVFGDVQADRFDVAERAPR